MFSLLKSLQTFETLLSSFSGRGVVTLKKKKKFSVLTLFFFHNSNFKLGIMVFFNSIISLDFKNIKKEKKARIVYVQKYI